MKSRSSLTPEQMAKTYTYLAVSPELGLKSDCYFDENNREVKYSKYCEDRDNIREVMQLTYKYITGKQ
ncbi:hypothetical protein M6D81_20675 [Paenibacillus sp. J5C_2022]|nr:hypothetical protein [Paenibacillus sp. J5C2022]